MTYLNYIFLLDASIFTTTDDEKKEKINSSTIFEEFYLNLKRKFWKFNTQKIELHTNAC